MVLQFSSKTEVQGTNAHTFGGGTAEATLSRLVP